MEMRAIHIGTRSTTERRSRTWTFLRHLFEMTVAMMLGMCVLGMSCAGRSTNQPKPPAGRRAPTAPTTSRSKRAGSHTQGRR
jgi:hypothetical protein